MGWNGQAEPELCRSREPTGTAGPTGPQGPGAIKNAVALPVCAIGGINESNIDDVIGAGADMAAVIAAVIAAPDVRGAAQRLAHRFAIAG